MIIYEKAAWYIDEGYEKSVIIEYFKTVMEYLDEKNMLNEYGKEIYEDGIDASISIHEDMLNEKGNSFMKENEDKYSISSLVSKILDELSDTYKNDH